MEIALNGNMLRAVSKRFSTARAPFLLRTAAASWAALVVAYALGLESPHWAAMTVWLVAMPTRGQILEKSLFRFIGTLVGSTAGFAMIKASGDSHLLLCTLLAIWVGVCCTFGNLLRHFRAYGIFLAGYTAAIIGLIGEEHPDMVASLATTRVACILVGIAVATLTTYFLTPDADTEVPTTELRRLAAETFVWAEAALAGQHRKDVRSDIVRAMGLLESQLDQTASGSRVNARHIRYLRGNLAALLSLMAGIDTVIARLARGTAEAEVLAQARTVLARHLPILRGRYAVREPLDVVGLRRDLRAVAPIETAASYPLRDIVRALAALGHDQPAAQQGDSRAFFDIQYHRDWPGAWRAGLRTLVAILAVGLLWMGTGWDFFAMALLGAAILSCLFSTFDDPQPLFRSFIRNSIIALGAAVVCRGLLNVFDHPAVDLVLILPFVLIGCLAALHRSAGNFINDYMMVFYLVSQPLSSEPLPITEATGRGLAVIAGFVIAALAFRFILPVDIAARRRALARAIVHELEVLAQLREDMPSWRWRARLQHRILRLASRTGSAPADKKSLEAALAALGIGGALALLRRAAMRDDLSLADRDTIGDCLAGLTVLSRHAQAAVARIDRAVERLSNSGAAPGAEIEALRDVATQMRDHGALLERA